MQYLLGNSKKQGINEILIENVRLTEIENDEIKIIGASNAAEVDRAREKVLLKLALIEDMFAKGELQIVRNEKPGVRIASELRGEN